MTLSTDLVLHSEFHQNKTLLSKCLLLLLEEEEPPPQTSALPLSNICLRRISPSPSLFCRYPLFTRHHVITVILPVPMSHVVKAPVLIFIWANFRAVTAAITKGNDAFIYLRRREGKSERNAVGGAPRFFTGICRSERAEGRTGRASAEIQAIFIAICAMC